MNGKADYVGRRQALYRPLRDEGIFTWDVMYDEEYALADIYCITEADRRELAEATSG